MKRRRLSKAKSRRNYKKNTGVQKLNRANAATMRGGIRL